MAKVISWVVGGKYVYIDKSTSTNKYIRDAEEGEAYIKDLGRKVTRGEDGWTESKYATNFSAMRTEVLAAFNGAVDIPDDYTLYYNATQEEGVYILTGRDGVDVASQNKPFYTIEITNNNTCLGLGGDYVLDVIARLTTHVRLERDGETYQPDQVKVDNGGWIVPTLENGYSKVPVTVAKNTSFADNNHVKEYTIYVKKGDWEGKVVFTVVGVRDGEEGVSYDLIVAPRQIKVTSEGDPSNVAVTCAVLKNGEKTTVSGGLSIKYDFGAKTTDVDDISGSDYTNPIPFNTISQNGDQVNFYLLFNGSLVDSDSAVISRDGVDAGHVVLELDNEIDGIGVGDDSKLDVSSPVHLGTGFILYSGSTKLQLADASVEGLGAGATATLKSRSGGSISGAYDGVLDVSLSNGFEFGEDLREAIKIKVTAVTDVTAEAIYTIVGVKGGKDGEVYKIIPKYDAIVYDPNNATRHNYGANAYLSAKPYIGTTEIKNNPEFTMSYSYDATYTTKGSTIAYTSGDDVEELKIDNLVGSESTQPKKYVVFYLWKGSTLVDRESVPILGQGINGSAVWVELGNELDAISVGSDTKLDLDNPIEVKTSVLVMSGTTQVPVKAIKIMTYDVEKPSQYGTASSKKAQWSTGITNNEAWVKVTLKDGFEFGEDYREQLYVTVTADTPDEWTGFAMYVLKGIPGGKDGYVYKVVPSVDYVTYNPNNNTLDYGPKEPGDNQAITCEAYYGKDKMGSGDFIPSGTDGIYYSINKVCETSADTSSSSSQFITGFTTYPSAGIVLGNIITPTNYKNIKYLVFYLLVDGDIVDRETVKIVSDGLDAHDNLVVELSNEIDSVGVGNDSKLDVETPVTASTRVILFSGATPLNIIKIEASGLRDPDPSKYAIKSFVVNDSDQTTSTEVSASTPAKKVEFQVILKDGFEFGEDLREKVTLKVTGKDKNNENVVGITTFVLAAIKGGKDGATYKIQPVPDYVVFDIETGEFSPQNASVGAFAYMNGEKMRDHYTYGTDYKIKYTTGLVSDLDQATADWATATYMDYTEGSAVAFASVSLTRSQNIVFYLAVKTDGGNWIVVDRESVPLMINGKEGKDGMGSVIFDLTNETFVISTGADEILDIGAGNSVTGGTYVVCRSGNTPVAIMITTATTQTFDTSHGSIVVEDNGTVKPLIKCTFRNGFNFGADRKIEINVSCRAIIDSTTGETIFSIVSVADGEEGKVYRIVPSAGSVLYDQNTKAYGPTSLSFKMYVGNSELSNVVYNYKVCDSAGTVVHSENNSATIPASAKYYNVTEGWVRVTGTTGGAWDACDIPIIPSGKNGSGLVADLTNDSDTVGLGGDLKLDLPSGTNYIDFVTTGYIMENATKIELTGSAVTPNVTGIAVTGTRSGDKKEYGFRFRMNNGFTFTASTGTKVEYTIKLTGTTKYEGSKEMTLKYIIQGLKDGEDGVVYKIIPSCSCIKSEYDKASSAYTYNPTTISAKTYNAGTEVTSNLTMFYTVNDEDGSDANMEPYTPGSVITLNNLYASDGIKNAITFYSYINNTTLVDKEYVPVVFDGVGGIQISTAPDRIGVPVDENKHPKETFHTTARVWMESASTLVAMTNTAITYNVAGSTVSKPNGLTVSLVADGQIYKKLEITANTSVTLSNPIVIQISARPQGGGADEQRMGTFILEENSGGKGDKGDKGAITRMRDWVAGLEYFDGQDGDEFWDFVYYEGSYYGCKKDVPSGRTVTPNNDTNYWTEYPEAEFTASKVATFGTWPHGWVIDSGKIQHTDSSITLDADGVVTVSEIERTYYKYKEDGGSEVLYTTKNYKDQALFKENKDGNVVTYKKLTSPVRYVYYSSDYVLSGTYSSPKLVYTENVNNSALYAYSTSSEDGFAFRISEPIARELSIETNATGYKVDTAYKLVADTYNPDIWSAVTWMVKVTPITGKFKGKITAGSSIVATSIENVSEGSYVYSGDTGEEYLTEAINVALPSSWGWVSYPSSYYPSASDWYESPIGQWIDDKTYYYCELDAFTMKVGSDQSTTEINLETAHLYVSSGSTDSNFSRTNQFKLSQNFPSGEAIVPTSKTLSYTNSTEKVQNIPNAKINSTESGRSEEDGNIIIAAGMEKNIAIYKWANGNDVIYTLYPYNTSSFGVENGGIVPIYDSIELPLEKNGTLQYDRGYTIVRILYNGVEYEATGTLYDGAVDPIMFANTRIYANGRIVTNNLYANDGTFNGILNARGGTFNGTITATDGVMENVDVKNGMFSGDIVLRGGNTITVYDEGATIPSVTISSKDISIAPTEYSVSAGGGTISKTNSTWGKISGTETIVLSTTNISAGSSVTIPSLKLSLDFKKKVESVSVSITYSTGGTDSPLLNVPPRSDTKDHFESNSAEKTFNVSAECVLTIKMRVQYSLKSGFMGYSALYATVSPNAPMKILNNTGSGFNQVVIGKNGISYAANDATFFVKRDGTKTSIMMKVKNLSNKYNGIQIDDDEVTIMFGNKTYKLTSNTVPVSGGVALVWSQSDQ